MQNKPLSDVMRVKVNAINLFIHDYYEHEINLVLGKDVVLGSRMDYNVDGIDLIIVFAKHFRVATDNDIHLLYMQVPLHIKACSELLWLENHEAYNESTKEGRTGKHD